VRSVRWIVIGLGAAAFLFITMLGFGVPIAWEIAFGVAYCVDGYPPCGARQ
jgi:hypothetical protein